MAMALPVYAEVDLLPDAPDEVELLEDEPGTASGENTVPPEQNAATPEPEQSAESEQPAPTETPEPTAEPTLTPEPAATATATPVPTVTPTATPEPTEQPEMDAEEAEDMDRALKVSTQSNQFTVYFAVPSSWEVTRNSKITFNAQRGNGGGEHDGEIGEQPMSLVHDKITSKGQRIYKIILTNGDNAICPWGGYVWMQFTLDESHKVRVTAPPEENNTTNHFVKVDGFNDKYYDGDANSENGDVAWNDADWANASALPDPAVHTAFGGQKMVFENLSDSDLANVTAVFTEQDSSGNTTATKTVTIGNVAKNKKQGFEIPTSACSSVQFVAGNDSEPLSTSYNFYEQGTDGNTFLYNASKKYCFTYNVNNQSTWGTPQGKQGKQVIYFDATFSWLSYENEKSETHKGAIGCGMPTNDGKLWCYLTGNGKDPITKKEMNRLENTNIWYCEVPDGYTKIRFASWAVENEKAADNGDGTDMMDIPADLSEPCFFADASDDVIYNGGNRGGYWAEKGTLRDAKEGKKLTDDVVDISKEPFTEDPDTKYVTSTLYDYYTDYELNGQNRKNYNYNYTTGEKGSFPCYRNWYTFRQFDSALSDYYRNCNAQYPIYTGHFQPTYLDWGIKFDAISAALNLWGFNSEFDKKNRFMAINNSTINEDGNGTRYDYAYQGLVESQTSTGDATGEPLLKDTKEDTKVVEPHFNKEFLSGTNSKNAKLGDVYNNVAFPFTKRQIFDEDTGVDYWYFDSQDTTLYLKQDSDTKQYFLKSSTENRERSRNLDSTSAQTTITKTGKNEPVSSYGYFPFNETATAGRASTYNYGFGTKLQMDFTLTDDGKVEKDNADGTKGKTSIKFFFSGDDDVWVFIDGKLALDVGGAHGKVSGLLEFGETEEKGKNSVTAYVSKVKKGGTPESNQNGSPAKTVKYKGEDINFYAQGTTLTFDKGQKHTLTMYYMERGMWESNMAVAFNFPDNNELQVQKIVDTTDVNDWFKSCFDTPDLFAFNIKNQATHYQNPKQDAIIDSDVNLIKLNNSDYASCKPATENSKGNIFERTTELGGAEALHWYAQYQDTNPPSECRSERYGILTLRNAIDISQKRYLTFDIYAKSESGQGVLSLGNLYLELLDKNGKQKGCLDKTCLNGTTYGTVTLANDEWITVKLDLYKLNAEEGFDPKQVTMIRVGDNYPRHIYFRNFVFSAQAKATTKTGFTTKQEDIPVYGSIDAKGLKNAAGAQFTTTKNNDTQVVDKNGQFMLQNGETVTFSDQFRRGSYISLKETLNPNLYDTTWTVFENDEAVQSYGAGKTVTGDSKDLKGQAATESQPDDGRTEVYNSTPGIANDGYTKDKKPDANTIVFRSYKDPDENTSSLTKLKVQFVNKVKTGKLVIKKAAASGEDNLIKGKYTFNVTFTNVGDEGLEQETIKKQVTIDMNSSSQYEIKGIPIGTRFRIEEEKTNDGSHLQGVSVTGGGVDTQVVGNTYVQGSISGSGTNVTATFTNTKHELINIDFTKTWKNANGDLLEDGLPDKIYIQLQRRKTESETWKPVKYPDANNSLEYVMVTPTSKGWDYPFANLDKFDVMDHTNYQYRIVEGTVDDEGSFAEVKPNKTITIKGNTYVVTAEAKAEISEGDSTKNTQATVNGGTITGDSGTIVLTNTLQNPKFVLDIIKKDAENGENNKEVFLKDVEFKLEKLVETTTEGETQWVVDKNYKFDSTKTDSITGTTGTDGKITGVFTNLEPGTYRLTETRAHAGYNLLAQPIEIKFTQDGKCYIDGQAIEDKDKFKPGTNNTYTMNLTVLNRKTPELPHTGADAPSLWLLIGMPLAVAGLLIFTFRYNRKGGRRH